MRFYREGVHHIKFKVDTLEVLSETGSSSRDFGGSSASSHRKVYDEYEGEMKNYQFDGRGVFLHASGERYDGEWQKGKRECCRAPTSWILDCDADPWNRELGPQALNPGGKKLYPRF